jgi:hypothetical protein
VGGQVTVNPEELGRDGKDHQHCEVGGHEQKYAFHADLEWGRLRGRSRCGAGAGGAGRSIAIAVFLVLFPVVVIVIFVVIIVPVVVLVLVEVFILVFFFLVILFVIASPAFRFLDAFEVHFVPGIQIELLDISIEVFDLDQLGIFVDGQHAEGLVLFHIFVPLSLDRFVISAHGAPSSLLAAEY